MVDASHSVVDRSGRQFDFAGLIHVRLRGPRHGSISIVIPVPHGLAFVRDFAGKRRPRKVFGSDPRNLDALGIVVHRAGDFHHASRAVVFKAGAILVLVRMLLQ